MGVLRFHHWACVPYNQTCEVLRLFTCASRWVGPFALRSSKMKSPRSSTTIAVALSFLSTVCVKACGDDHTRARMHKRLPSSAPITPPTRPLEWGDINIIHTTDTHGWLLGHQKGSFPEPNYSGDFGGFASFVSHMKQTAKVINGNICICL
jgi:hypothetical protein